MVDDLTVRDVMTREYVGVSESDPVVEVARLMIDEGASSVAVLRGSEAVGTVMPHAILDTLLDDGDPDEQTIDAIMQHPPRIIRADRTLADAAAILAEVNTDHVFVDGPDGLLGVLTENDVITAVTSMLTTDPGEAFDDDYAAGVPDESDEFGSMSSQSVCEVCGTLKTDLENINGQLVCDDCRVV